MDEEHWCCTKTYIRPRMEHCVQAWSPYLQKDIQIRGKVQRAATKIVTNLKTCSYEDRRSPPSLMTLEMRRPAPILSTVDRMWFRITTKICSNSSWRQMNQPSMASDIACWSDSSRSSKPRMSSGSVMIFVVGLARTNVSNMHFTWWYWRISPPVLLYGFVTTCGIITQ